MRTLITCSAMLALAAAAAGCGAEKADSADEEGTTGTTGSTGTTGTTGTTDDPAPLTDLYAFESALTGENSVAYSGQVFRQVLINEMKSHLGLMTDRLNTGAFFPAEGDVVAELDFYFRFDSSVGGEVPLYLSADLPTEQTVYNDISTDKDLVGKLAGNDTVGQHKDWSTEFVGWDADGVTSPETLVIALQQMVDDQAVAWASGNIPLGPDGAPVPSVYVTPDGLDLQQLLQKFIRVGVAFSQGADDYMDDDTDGKGLLSDHTAASEGKPYTSLEHQWDEGFGYFGASRSYPERSDTDISDAPAFDADGNGTIDLQREWSAGHSVNAAKRDRGAVVATDMTQQAWDGFYNGRALLAETAGSELSAEQFAELQGYRDEAVLAWEQAIASTAIHYINDVLQDMNKMGSGDYDFGTHAKHWGELKGFALAPQFNPRSPLSDSDFAQVHALIGTRPVLETADESTRAAYAGDLVDARFILGAAYGFDLGNLGDENGENGW